MPAGSVAFSGIRREEVGAMLQRIKLRNLTLVGHSRLKFAPGKRTFTGTSGFDPKQTLANRAVHDGFAPMSVIPLFRGSPAANFAGAKVRGEACP
jgi:hypothetical protein